MHRAVLRNTPKVILANNNKKSKLKIRSELPWFEGYRLD
jgi:hypothetical protein